MYKVNSLWKFYNAGAKKFDGQPADGQFHVDRRLVVSPEGILINRHWDDTDNGLPFEEFKPRLEAVAIDTDTADIAASRVPVDQQPRVRANHYQARKSAAESGEDFSLRRWANGKDLSHLNTPQIIPVDLTSAMANAARILKRSFEITRDRAEQQGNLEGASREHKKAVYFAKEEIGRETFAQRYHSPQNHTPALNPH